MVKRLGPVASSDSTKQILAKLPPLAVLLLLVLIAWSLAQLVWLVLTPEDDGFASTNNVGASRTAASAADPAETIVAGNLFGIASAKPQESVATSEAPETKLNLKLRGVYALEDGKGYALIANGTKPEELVLIGQDMPGNVTLKEVYGDRVILSRAGKLETLKLPASESSGISYTPAPPSAPDMEPTEDDGDMSEPTDLKGFRDQMMRNPSKLAELINAAPAREDDKFVGYQITTLKDHPMLSMVDIQTGDIVTKINGIEINSPADGMKALQQLSKSDDLQLTLNRGGQIIEVNQSF